MDFLTTLLPVLWKGQSFSSKYVDDSLSPITMFVLDFNWVAFEIDGEIKTANMLSKAKYLDGSLLISGSFDVNRTNLFPI